MAPQIMPWGVPVPRKKKKAPPKPLKGRRAAAAKGAKPTTRRGVGVARGSKRGLEPSRRPRGPGAAGVLKRGMARAQEGGGAAVRRGPPRRKPKGGDGPLTVEQAAAEGKKILAAGGTILDVLKLKPRIRR